MIVIISPGFSEKLLEFLLRNIVIKHKKAGLRNPAPHISPENLLNNETNSLLLNAFSIDDLLSIYLLTVV